MFTRVKDVICESDQVRRNPLRVVPSRPEGDGRDQVVLTDWQDDPDTLDGRINARGRASALRRHDVDNARSLTNRVEIYSKYAPVLRELVKSLRDEGEWHAADAAENALVALQDVVPDEYDMAAAMREVRRPIYVGDPSGILKDHAGHERAWERP